MERVRRERVVRMSVEVPLWRALAAYRLLTTLYTIVLFGYERHRYERLWLGVAYLAVLLVWTVATLPRVSGVARCTRPFLACDLTLALVGILITPLADQQARGADVTTLPSIWTAGAVLAFALKGGWRPALAASTLVAVADIVERAHPSKDTLHNVVLVWIASIGIGYVVEVARASERTLARALEIEAATRERERLARDIHDSVLQVLAMVQRRGTALGGEAAELGRMAGEQEIALRTLVTSGLLPPAPLAPGATETPDGADAGGAWATPRDPGPPDPAGPATRTASPADGQAESAGGAPRARSVRGDGRDPRPDRDGGGGSDLRALLARYAGARVSLAEPGAPVLLPAAAAAELAAAVGAALDNVRRHAGADAGAWILVEDEPGQVIVTVRDDGPGIPEGRLAQAEGEGRLGVAQSIRGRLADLGGAAELISVPGQGTEVELKVPRQAGDKSTRGRRT
ncbi:MacS family sensor histidine kinase [Streptomyces sp. NBC_01497]|uniref:MacS family sensor histidine kinase n=1 Tax=Streptomyces sp. NBC_01497 TaxID=2903885 RepID=UPI002E2F3136|nr:DUF5931 domain-containing protein [Streptomyces sp. NBC_01497]